MYLRIIILWGACDLTTRRSVLDENLRIIDFSHLLKYGATDRTNKVSRIVWKIFRGARRFVILRA